MNKHLFMLVVALINLIPIQLLAAPSISGIGGTVSHGESITISGSDFGTKATAAPAKWDDCSGTTISTLWDGSWPIAANQPLSTPRYAQPSEINNVATAHSRATKYIAGRTYDGAESGQGFPNDIGFWDTVSSQPSFVYATWWQRVDPNNDSGDNFKWFDYSGGNSPYDNSGNWYLEYVGGLGGHNHINDNAAGIYQALCDGSWGRDYTCNSWYFATSTNPTTQWVKIEILINVSSSNTVGYIDMFEDGVLQISTNQYATGTHSYNGNTDSTISGSARTIFIGGYSRTAAATNWRYWNDIYIDYTQSRAMICAGSTWSTKGLCEPQIPSAWDTDEITVTVNQASFDDEETAYLYVVKSDGTYNSDGYGVTLGGTTISATTSGTVTESKDEADMRTAGLTLIVDITGDTLNAFDNTIRAAILAGLNSSVSATGTNWASLIEGNENSWGNTGVVRTDDDTFTITFPDFDGDPNTNYDNAQAEVITVVIPASALVGGEAITATGTFTIGYDAPASVQKIGASVGSGSIGMTVGSGTIDLRLGN